MSWLPRAASIASRRSAGLVHRYSRLGGTLAWRTLSHPTFATQADAAPPFDKILIANRGEIVSRVARTCRRLGVSTLGLYATADAQAPFVQDADETICLGSPTNYLNQDYLLQVLKETGAQALHPGYGFLSENAIFNRKVADSGVVWLGPPADSVEQMGDKIQSKVVAQQAGVTVVPGYDGALESLEQALQISHETIGYPVLLKAAAGGGGKGMRICYNDADLKESWPLALSEAMQFFGDDRLLVEKYIEDPHHIEFQVLCSKDQVVVFPERECSIQRRHQKILEESPSMLLTDETRRAMAKQVHQLCQAVGYESAGTVEFLVDPNQNFYFLEMNTRLQVEHCVSEAVCDGIDLVEGMLWVGAGWGLPPKFPRLEPGEVMPFSGHAIEARIYAEDPLRNYMPSTGPLTPYVEPANGLILPSANPAVFAQTLPETYVRMDSGVAPGQNVTPHFDPMLSKVITRGPDRDAAIQTMCHALDEYVIEGVQHNARLVQSVLREPAFAEGDTPTSFLKRHYPDGFKGVALNLAEMEEFAVVAAALKECRRGGALSNADGQPMIVRLGGLFGADAFEVQLMTDEATEKPYATVKPWSADTDADNETTESRIIPLEAPKSTATRYVWHLTLDDEQRAVQHLKNETTGEMWLQMYGARIPVLIQSPREAELSVWMKEPVPLDTSQFLLSPMPGTIVRYAVEPGDAVEAGQELCIVEAMKMQNVLKSDKAGVVKACMVNVGASVKADQPIVEFESSSEAEAA